MLALSAAVVLVIAAAGVSEAALLGHYQMGETQGPTLSDSGGVVSDSATSFGSGHIYGQGGVPDGTYGALTLSGAPFGASVGLSAASGEWRTNPHPEYGSLVNNFTAMAWIRPDNVTGVKRVLGKNRLDPDPNTAGNQSANNSWSFGIDAQKILFTAHGVLDHRSNDVVQAGAWQHIAITKSSVTGVKFFHNGAEVPPFTAGSPTATGDTRPVLPTDLDPYWLLLNTFGGQNFLGLVDEVRVYDSVLTLDEIRAAAVPEPSAVAALAGVVCVALGRRRGRGSALAARA